MEKSKKIVLDPFCYRQFLPSSSSYIPFDKQSFEDKINELYDQNSLREGYAPFCKHIFVQNFTQAISSTHPITKQNEHLLRSVYQARTQKQLPVLRRYFPFSSVGIKKAKYLDIILYSYEQVQKENQGMKSVDPNKDLNYHYAIVSIKPQDTQTENPMDPITMMRNSLGVQHGGSGVALDKQKYLQSVKFWSQYAIIK